MQMQECGMLVLGRQLDGTWTITAGEGPVIGRFTTFEAALSHAEGKRRTQPDLAIASSQGAVRVGRTMRVDRDQPRQLFHMGDDRVEAHCASKPASRIPGRLTLRHGRGAAGKQDA